MRKNRKAIKHLLKKILEHRIIKQRKDYANTNLDIKIKSTNIVASALNSKEFNEYKGYDTRWIDFYHKLRPDIVNWQDFIPEDYWYCMIDYQLSHPDMCKIVDDKNIYSLLFPDVKQPETLVRCIDGTYLNDEYQIISKEEALEKIISKGKVIIKPSISTEGGRGIRFWNKDTDLVEDLPALISKECIIQSIVEQHEEMSKLHKESLNTIRILSLLLDNNVEIISTVVRMGVGDSKIDNVSSGGIACGVLPDGSLNNFAFNGNAVNFKQHPQGCIFNNIIIPRYNDCVSLVKKLHPRLKRFSKLISWDLAIDKEGNPILIEVNLSFGEIDFHQMCNGPVLTKEQRKLIIHTVHDIN